MTCLSLTDTWETTLCVKDTFQSISASKQYVVQVNRAIGFFTERYLLLVNGKQIQNNLSRNECSPLCGSGGEFGWEQDGHYFLLMYNSLDVYPLLRRGFRLFVDGIDVETGLEFRAYWRRKGLQYLFWGLFIALVGVVAVCLYHFRIFHRQRDFPYYIGYILIVLGVVVFAIRGLIAVLRQYKGPRYHYGTSTFEYIRLECDNAA